MDRIQKENGIISVLDYKTGNVDKRKLSYTNNDDVIDNSKTNALQLICYALLYSKKINHKGDIKAGIVSFKHINDGVLWLNEKTINKETKNIFNKSDLVYFEELIAKLIEQIYDTNISFKNE
jgi:hypothetical protein